MSLPLPLPTLTCSRPVIDSRKGVIVKVPGIHWPNGVGGEKEYVTRFDQNGQSAEAQPCSSEIEMEDTDVCEGGDNDGDRWDKRPFCIDPNANP